MHLSMFYPQMWSGECKKSLTAKISQVPNPRELDRALKHRGAKLDASSEGSEMNHLTILIVHTGKFGPQILTHGGGGDI